MSMTRQQHILTTMMQKVAADEGTDNQGALRDMLTDLRHVAATYALDFEFAIEGSAAVQVEEQAEEPPG